MELYREGAANPFRPGKIRRRKPTSSAGQPQAYPIWLPASKLFVYLTQKIIIKNEKKYHATKIAIQKLYLSYILYGIK